MATPLPEPADRPYQYKVFVLPCWSCKGERDLPVPRAPGNDARRHRVRCYACKGNGIASIVFRLPLPRPPG
jgi:hypothetical protein